MYLPIYSTILISCLSRKYSGLHLKKLIDENIKLQTSNRGFKVSRYNKIYRKYGLDKLFLYIGSEVKAQVTEPYSIKEGIVDYTLKNSLMKTLKKKLQTSNRGFKVSRYNKIYRKYGLDKLFLYIGSEVKAQVTDPYSIKKVQWITP